MRYLSQSPRCLWIPAQNCAIYLSPRCLWIPAQDSAIYYTSPQGVCKYQPRTVRYLSTKCLWIPAQDCAIPLHKVFMNTSPGLCDIPLPKVFVNTSPGLCDISLGDNKRKWESPVSTTFGKGDHWDPLTIKERGAQKNSSTFSLTGQCHKVIDPCFISWIYNTVII